MDNSETGTAYTTTAVWGGTKHQAKVAAAVLGKTLVQVMDEAVRLYSQQHGVPLVDRVEVSDGK